MKKWKWMAVLVAGMILNGCEGLSGPDTSGEITLSSQLHGTESYYLFGYSYDKGEMYKFPSPDEPIPDIINEGFLVIEGSEQLSLPGFNTPGQKNGFVLVGEFNTLNEASEFFNGYSRVEDGLQFETLSDTVELHQVWVQQTSAGHYVKMVIEDIHHVENESGKPYNEVSLKYKYAPDGSMQFQ